MQDKEAFGKYIRKIGYNKNEAFFVRKGWQASRVHILSFLDSPEMDEHVANALWESDLIVSDAECDMLTGIAIDAIKERIENAN